jgi:branched-chain amino acid transport system permease protein
MAAPVPRDPNEFVVELLSQVLISGITLGSLYALVGLGFVVIYRATKVVNFAQGEMMMLACSRLFLFPSVVSYFMAFSLAVVLGVFGAGLERFAYRPLLNVQSSR